MNRKERREFLKQKKHMVVTGSEIGYREVIDKSLARVQAYKDNYVRHEPINTIEIVFCGDCRHAERTESNVWPYHCRRLGRSRMTASYCRVVEKRFGDRQGWVFWDAK